MNPILICSLERYTKCVDILYRHGYRVKLLHEDEENIKGILHLNSDRKTKKKMLKQLDKKIKDDPVSRCLKLQAHASPDYIAAAFEDCERRLKKKKEITYGNDLIQYTNNVFSLKKE